MLALTMKPSIAVVDTGHLQAPLHNHTTLQYYTLQYCTMLLIIVAVASSLLLV